MDARPSGSCWVFWRICERVGKGSGTGAFETTFRNKAAAHQVNTLGFTFIGEKQFGNLCRSKAGLARNERFDRISYSDKVPATVFPARNRSVAHLHDASPIVVP